MIRSSNRFHELLVSFYFYKERVVTEVVSFKKFRLISEEATSEKPFIWKKGCDKTLSQPLSWAYLSPILL